MERIDTRGCPRSVHSSRATSSGSPCVHGAKPGDAIRLLSSMARSKRSAAGKNASRSSTPTRSKPGCWIAWISSVSSSDRPSLQASAMMRDSRMCSRLRTGSASTPSSDSRPDTVPSTRSRSASSSPRSAAAGASSLRSTAIGVPAVLPGVYRAKSAAARSRAIRSPSWPHSFSPSRHRSAVRAACSSGVTPWRAASASSIQGRKSCGLSSGNVSSRLPRSPFGSIAITGT